MSSYQQIKTLCSQLRQRTRRNSNDSLETSSSSEEIVHPDSLKSGSLSSAMHELKGLVHDLLRKEAKGACLACGADTNEKLRMEVKIHKTQEENEKLERRLKELEDLGKRKDDEILDVKSKVKTARKKNSLGNLEMMRLHLKTAARWLKITQKKSHKKKISWLFPSSAYWF